MDLKGAIEFLKSQPLSISKEIADSIKSQIPTFPKGMTDWMKKQTKNDGFNFKVPNRNMRTFNHEIDFDKINESAAEIQIDSIIPDIEKAISDIKDNQQEFMKQVAANRLEDQKSSNRRFWISTGIGIAALIAAIIALF